MTTRIVDGIALVVAPGEPDDPARAQGFILSWWEKNPPPGVGWTAKDCRGWCFITKPLGPEGRALVNAGYEAALWVEMFGGNQPTVVMERRWGL